jgi:hypothetical protein
MAKPMTPEMRIRKARQIIEEAQNIPAPDSVGWERFSYIAQVKDTLRKTFELIKLIGYSPSASAKIKADAKAVIDEDSASIDFINSE